MALPNAASVVSSGLAGYPTIYYDRVALDTLESNLALYPACDLKTMPNMSGTAMQVFNHTAYGPNTTPATEGTPGSGQTMTQNIRVINLSQFVDYVSFSDKVVMTAISDTVAEGAKLLSYRGALSVDTTISTLLDTVAAGTTGTSIDLADGTYFSASVSRKAAMQLRSVNVKPKNTGRFLGVISSLQAFDLINDASAGGFLDTQKHVESGVKLIDGGVDSRNFIGSVGGVDWYESNAVPIDSGNYLSTTHNGYHCYVIGNQAVIGSSLGKTALGQKNFTVKVSRFDQPIAVDPANQIKAAASYNFFWGCINKPGAVPAFKRIRSESSIG